MRVLIVEDERNLAETLQQMLKTNRFDSDICLDGEKGLKYAREGAYDLIILDIMLPKVNGFTIVEQLRNENNDTPILVLTARSSVEDYVHGLDLGADYYLTKPFEMQELLACVRALTRRHGEVVMDTLAFGDLVLNKSTCELSCGDRTIRLGKKEFSIMHLFMTNGNVVVSKEQILHNAWGIESEAEDNNVEVYISFLRKKLRFLHTNTQIETLRKFGYKLQERKA
ncbi:MAG: response regulator transcription factor [Clostridia bacterium]|nr:response regulator transcription factor [Clostridia bacterium]MBR3129910.1 response regulator transcription factor [Clostridia bacterium]